MEKALPFQGIPPKVIPPVGTVPSGVILVTQSVTLVPIGPADGVRVTTAATIVKVADDTVPAAVVTEMVLLPQQAAVSGTLRLMFQCPEPSIGISTVFQGELSNFNPPMGILSSGTKLEPVRDTSVYGGPLAGETVVGGLVTVKVAVATVPPVVATLTVLEPGVALAGTLRLVFQ